MKTFLVGGAVRDELLNRNFHELFNRILEKKLEIIEKDYVVVGATEEDMLKKGFIKVGKDFPVFLDPKTKEEYALARTEKKQGLGYYGFECNSSNTVTLEADLKRRDITINAIAKSEDGALIDPFEGQADLQNKIIRHVSSAFVEDPLRVLRVARFKAKLSFLGFTIHEQTKALMKQMVATGELNELTPERVWKEIYKALQEKSPEQFFETLRECGALKIIFPELDRLWGIPQNKEYHPEIDTGVHVMMALKEAARLTDGEAKVVFAVLCHDLGKGLTPREIWPSHKGHDLAGIEPIKAWCIKYNVPNIFRDLAIVVAKYHIKLHSIFHVIDKDIKDGAAGLLEILEGIDAFRNKDIINQFLLACLADIRGRIGKENANYSQGELLERAYNAAKAVKLTREEMQPLSGMEINNKIRKLRVDAIIKVCQT